MALGSKQRVCAPKASAKREGSQSIRAKRWSGAAMWSSDVGQRVAQCEGCGGLLAQEPVKAVYARQVHDIPPVVLKVTEHQAEVKGCPHCGLENQAAFPAEAKSVVQYGARLKSMMVYLMEG